MIRIKVELVPASAFPDAVREIALMEITNIGPHGSSLADYSVRWVTFQPNGDLSIQQWALHNFSRRKWNVWGLIFHALKDLPPAVMQVNDVEPRPWRWVPKTDLAKRMIQAAKR